MTTAPMYLTDFHVKTIKKDLKYQKKRQRRAVESLSVEESKKVKSVLSQLYCTTALQVALIDEMNEIMDFAMNYPFIQDFQRGMERLNTDLYQIAVKSEENDKERQRLEEMMENIVCEMPKLSLKQLGILEEFIGNLKYKK